MGHFQVHVLSGSPFSTISSSFRSFKYGSLSPWGMEGHGTEGVWTPEYHLEQCHLLAMHSHTGLMFEK